MGQTLREGLCGQIRNGYGIKKESAELIPFPLFHSFVDTDTSSMKEGRSDFRFFIGTGIRIRSTLVETTTGTITIAPSGRTLATGLGGPDQYAETNEQQPEDRKIFHQKLLTEAQ